MNRCDADFDGYLTSVYANGDVVDYKNHYYDHSTWSTGAILNNPKLTKWATSEGFPMGSGRDYKYHFCAGGHAYYYEDDDRRLEEEDPSAAFAYDSDNDKHAKRKLSDGERHRSFSGLDTTKPVYQQDGPYTYYDTFKHISASKYPGGGDNDMAKYPAAEHTTAYYDCCCDDPMAPGGTCLLYTSPSPRDS